MALIMECRMHPVFFSEYLSMKNPKGLNRDLRLCGKCVTKLRNFLDLNIKSYSASIYVK